MRGETIDETTANEDLRTWKSRGYFNSRWKGLLRQIASPDSPRSVAFSSSRCAALQHLAYALATEGKRTMMAFASRFCSGVPLVLMCGARLNASSISSSAFSRCRT